MEPREYHWPFSVLFSFLVEKRIEPVLAHVGQRLPIPESAETLLDIGGGDGRLAMAIAKYHPTLSRIITADVSPEMTRLARDNINRHGWEQKVFAEVQDVHRMTYADSSLDWIVSFASFHHWEDPVQGLGELWRCLKPEGWLTIIDGYDRPSFGTIRRALAPIGNSFSLCFALWLGRWDFLKEEDIRNIVQQSKLDNASLEFEPPVAVVTATRSERGREDLKMPASLFR